ncbi:hypothetical protein SERLA73DRAFT_154631 [Serpula lacrymans var. lacrymans S7.3]|uniref:Defective in cullin neddylation protein n=1 Tax=Serpula lacrymans var. lacrymans (strain S7.3) TaxID=936435 RepID=F8Q6L8_SERL3|nr:hypothetical protein SERLA73DRAFT_154631 [Serpula lacrymans var. lacrymans S7.3]
MPPKVLPALPSHSTNANTHPFQRKRDDTQTTAGDLPSSRITRASGRATATTAASIDDGTTAKTASASAAKKPRVAKATSAKAGSSRSKTSPPTLVSRRPLLGLPSVYRTISWLCLHLPSFPFLSYNLGRSAPLSFYFRTFALRAHSFMRLSSIFCCISNSNPTAHSPDVEGPRPQNLSVTSQKSAEKYNPDHIFTLFTHFASASSPTPDDGIPDYIGPEGFELLCNEANLPLSGALPLILAWQLGAGEMGRIKKDEWVNGLSRLRISSVPVLSLALYDLEDLLLLGKTPLTLPSSAKTAAAGPPPVKGRKRGAASNVTAGGNRNSRTSKGSAAGEPYNRTLYFNYASDKKKAFGELYQFCFALAKPPQGRNIDIETAIAFWSVLLTPQYPIITEVIEFLNEKGTYKGANKDLWSMMLEFCRTVDIHLEGYEMDGAWPTLLDDFVSWQKHKRAGIRESGIVIEEPE